MSLDAFLIFVLVLAGFYRYRVERQAEIEADLFEKTRCRYGLRQ